jgi:hypothetical protein
MRPTQLTSLVLVGLLVSATSALAGRPSFRPPAPVRTGKSQVLQSWVVQGFGVEEKDAKKFALEEAKKQLLKYLNDQGIVLKWDPPLSYIESLAKHFEPAEDKEVPVAGHVKQLEIQVLFESKDLRYMLEKEGELRGQDRMMLLGKFLAGLVAFLMAVAGYFRLEEATKGYYTLWLRLGMLGFIAAVGVGIWLVA